MNGERADLPTRVVSAPTVESTEPDDVVGGTGRRLDRYVLIDRIGRGGMGDVYLAYDPQLDRRVAVKLLRRRGSSLALPAERLLQEARALAKLNHPNVVAVYDAGTVDAHELTRTEELGPESLVFVAMEYVEGITLRTWLQTPRAWRDVVSVMRAAGAGLAAAHREGIVHRDFKPANVIVGDDGRVRVLDFGLARRFGRDLSDVPVRSEDDPSGFSSSGTDSVDSLSRRGIDSPATETGMVMGTPAYMAPEQMVGGTVDARTDQFTFCVVLHEALYGRRPFAGATLRELWDAIFAGPPIEGEPRARIPRTIRDAIVRGLDPDRERRHASMDELLLVLERATRPRTRALLTIGAATIAAVGIGVGLWAAARPGPCEGAGERLVGTWDAAREGSLSEAFSKTALPYADDAARGAIAALDEYAEEWTSARTDACIATVRGEQSAELLDLRMTCLDRRLQEMDAFVDLLLGADRRAVENAVKGARSLVGVDACADAEALRATIAPPADLETRRAVDEVYDEVSRARALSSTGAYAEAAELAEAALESARAIGYGPLVADAAIEAASAHEMATHRDPPLPLLLEALEVAAASGHIRAEAATLCLLLQHLGFARSDLESAIRYDHHARGVLHRIGNPPDLVLKRLAGIGISYFQAGRYDEAEAAFTEGLELRPGDEDLELRKLPLLSTLGAIHSTRGQLAEAEQNLQASLELIERVLGPHHPTLGIARTNLGVVSMQAGRPQEAMEHYARSEEILRAAFPNGHLELAKLLSNQGQVHKALGDLEKARGKYDEALAMKRKLAGDRDASIAHTANNLGDLQMATGDLVGARENAELALSVWEATLGDQNPVLAYALVTLAQLDLAEGDPVTALGRLERALELRETAGESPTEILEVKFFLARALIAAKRDPARARVLAEASLESARSNPNMSEDDIRKVERWLRGE